MPAAKKAKTNSHSDVMTPHHIHTSKFRAFWAFCLVVFLFIPAVSGAQETFLPQKPPSPKGAFFRSLVLPGWGHHYIDKTNWKRGQLHMAADVVMILTYAGIRVQNGHLQNNLETFVRSNADIDLASRNRELFLAVGDFDNLQEYNDYQMRTRNWDNLLEDIPNNRWNWTSNEARFDYNDMRKRIDNNENQLPALLTLMVVNRVVSGISAFAQARNYAKNIPEAGFSYVNQFGEPGFTASLKFNF